MILLNVFYNVKDDLVGNSVMVRTSVRTVSLAMARKEKCVNVIFLYPRNTYSPHLFHKCLYFLILHQTGICKVFLFPQEGEKTKFPRHHDQTQPMNGVVARVNDLRA